MGGWGVVGDVHVYRDMGKMGVRFVHCVCTASDAWELDNGGSNFVSCNFRDLGQGVWLNKVDETGDFKYDVSDLKLELDRG